MRLTPVVGLFCLKTVFIKVQDEDNDQMLDNNKTLQFNKSVVYFFCVQKQKK